MISHICSLLSLNISLEDHIFILHNIIHQGYHSQEDVYKRQDLSDGMAYDHGVKKGILKPEHNFENDIIEAARNIAKRYHTNRNHTIVMEQLALTIFDKLKNVHGLGRRERCV